jgi:anti-sigma regulatory factor (Ser/Thr protein kinase)
LPAPSSPSVNVLLAAAPDAPSGARRAVRALARNRVADLHAVELAVSEAVNNAVLHAYRDRDPAAGPGKVQLTAVVRDDELRITVTDEGIGMRPRVDSPGAGLGLALMGTLADRIDIDQRRGGTRVTLAFRVTPRGSAPDCAGAGVDD